MTLDIVSSFETKDRLSASVRDDGGSLNGDYDGLTIITTRRRFTFWFPSGAAPNFLPASNAQRASSVETVGKQILRATNNLN
jgi:hypothetical protein